MRGPSTVLFLGATVLLACLPGAQPQLAQLGRVWTPVDVDKNVHLQQISTYIKAMNDRNIFSSTAVPTNILSVAETSEPQGGKRYFYTLDVAKAGVGSVLQIEAYMDEANNEPRVVLPMPVKNMKASSPETFTSPTDVWHNVDVKDPFVVEAAERADALLQSTVFSASASGRPQLKDVVHAEKRTRDLSVELQYLQKLEADNAAEGPAVVADIAKKRAELVTKLSAKASALQSNGVDHPTVVTLTCESTGLQNEIASLEAKQSLLEGSTGRAGQQRLTSDSALLLTSEMATQQGMVLAGTVVPDSHSYAFLVLTYQTVDNFVVSTMRKQVLVYKDLLGGWKLVSCIDFGL